MRRAGRPGKYPEHWTESQRVAARTRERKEQGWTNPRFWLAPGFDRTKLDKYIARENKRALADTEKPE